MKSPEYDCPSKETSPLASSPRASADQRLKLLPELSPKQAVNGEIESRVSRNEEVADMVVATVR